MSRVAKRLPFVVGLPKPDTRGRRVSKLGFREIASAIREAIKSGTYPTGEPMPSEPELAEQYGGGASRSLVNRAMQLLAAEGMVRPRQGRGTIVTWLPPLTHSPAR